MNQTPSENAALFDLSSLNLQNLPGSFPASEKAENSEGEKFVVFFLDDERFAVSAREVAEIVRPLEYTPLPNAPEWLHGIANLRGEIISVLNLSKIFQKKPLPVSPKSRLIVLKPQTKASSMAFPADRLSEIITLPENEIHPPDDPRFLGKAAHETAAVNLLDTEKLVSSLS